MARRIGIDLGGTSAKVALVRKGHVIARETSVATSGFPKPAALVGEITLAIRRLLGSGQPDRIGIGVAGDIDSDHGIVRVSPNLGWKNVPLKALFARHFGCRIEVDNDANVAAWGLYHTQVPLHIKHMAVLTLGTGVGGGLIIDGRLHRGSTGSAGEIGHLNIDRDGPLCNCGNRGCLETYIGGPHLVARARRAIEEGRKTALRKVFQSDPSTLSPLTISQAAQAGDAFALSLWNEAGTALGIAIGDLVYLLNPKLIFFTGGVAQAGELILKPMRAALHRRAFKTPVAGVTIKVARNAPNIGVVGAALL